MSRGDGLRSLKVGLRDMAFLVQAVGAMEGRLAGEGPRAGRFWGWGGDQRQDGYEEGAVRRGEDEVTAKAVSMEHASSWQALPQGWPWLNFCPSPLLGMVRVSDFPRAMGNWNLWVKGISWFSEIGDVQTFKNLHGQPDLSVDCLLINL